MENDVGEGGGKGENAEHARRGGLSSRREGRSAASSSSSSSLPPPRPRRRRRWWRWWRRGIARASEMTEIASLGGREKARDSRQGERGTRRVACSGRIGKEKRCISLVGASERRRNRRGARGRKKPSYIMDASEMTEFQGGEKERGQRGRGKERSAP